MNSATTMLLVFPFQMFDDLYQGKARFTFTMGESESSKSMYNVRLLKVTMVTMAEKLPFKNSR